MVYVVRLIGRTAEAARINARYRCLLDLEGMQAYIDPESKLVKAVLVDKATRLAAAGLERLLDEAEAQGLPRDEALAICDGRIEELRERDESDHVFQSLFEALENEIKRREDG